MTEFKTLTKLQYQQYVKGRSDLDKQYNRQIIEKYEHVMDRNRTIANRYYENNKDKVSERHKVAYEKKKTIKKDIKSDENTEKVYEEPQIEKSEDKEEVDKEVNEKVNYNPHNFGEYY